MTAEEAASGRVNLDIPFSEKNQAKALAKSIEVARAGVQSGVWPLYEVLDGEDFKLNYKPKELKPVTEYLKSQGRFRHMTEEEIGDIQNYTTSRWELLEKADELKKLIM